MLPPQSSDQDLPPSDSSGGGASAGAGLLAGFTGGGGLPPIFTPLYDYTVIKPYQSERTKLVGGMLADLTKPKQQYKREGRFVPRTLAEKELFEAGMLS